jgi:predicted transposase YdaD
MPEKKHLRGVSDKEQRQYEHIKEEAKKEGRYKGREEEVAARTVLKQHGESTTRKASSGVWHVPDPKYSAEVA